MGKKIAEAKRGSKNNVQTMKAQVSALGPYSAGKIITTENGGTWGYSSGQIAIHPKTGKLISPNKPAGQARQALLNLKNLAKANGFKLNQHTIKATVFLT